VHLQLDAHFTILPTLSHVFESNHLDSNSQFNCTQAAFGFTPSNWQEGT